MKKGWSEVAFTDFATLVRREESIDDDGEYPEVGVRCFGKGLFHKLARTGIEVGDKKLFRLKEGDFILQVTFAWEGAVAIVGKEDESLFGSVRVLTFEIDAAVCDTRFLLWYFRTAAGVAQLARISPGSAGRNKVLAIGRLGEMRIPLPPLAEQQRIVGHLDAIEARLTRAQKLREEQEHELKSALSSAFHKLEAKAEWVEIGEVAPLYRRPTEITLDAEYQEIGARSFGKGIFHKPTLRGESLTWQKLFQVHAGDIVISNIKAWEGAIAVAGKSDHGRYGSHRYLTCVVDPERALPEFVCFYLLSSSGLEQVGSASPGSADRNRTLAVERLNKIKVPIVPLATQAEFQKLLDLRRKVRIEAAQTRQRTIALIPSLLDRIFNS
jgi:type I restriction enzyme, S subunit